MKKKLLSLLLCIVMVLSLMPMSAFAADTAYDVWVNGEQFTSDNLSITCGSGTAVYDPAKGELTLNNATITNVHSDDSINAAVYSGETLTVVLKGSNTVSPASSVDAFGFYSGSGDLTVSGDGDLTVTSNGHGIYTSRGNITISGGGNRTFYSTCGSDKYYSAVDSYKGDIDISGTGTLTIASAPSASAEYYVGLYSYWGSLSVSGSVVLHISDVNIGTYSEEATTFASSGEMTVDASVWGVGSSDDIIFSGTGKATISGGEYGAFLFDSGKSVLLNGTGTPISLTAGEGHKAVWNNADSRSPVGGTNFANYDETGAPNEQYVVYTLKSGTPIKITEIAISNADITPVAGEKAGDHMAYTLPTDCHYAATMNGWWDILGSKIMDSDDEFEAGGLYCASWNFVADDGYAFADDTIVTINGSADNVDAEHSYLDTTGDKPLYILSAKGVFVELAAETYTVTFDANGGTVTPTSGTTVAGGKLSSLPVPTHSESYRFDGWYTAANGGTKVTVDNVYTADTTIYAHWTYTGGGATYYTLTFNTNGGSAISSVSGTYCKVIDLDKYVPTKNGFDFGGWYSDSALTTPVDEIKLTGNKTVYAKWIIRIPFTDVKATDWSYDDIYYVWEKGLMQGTSETTFAPKIDTSRAMIVTILYRLEGEPAFMNDNIFTDVERGSWYEKAVIWANGKGIVLGYGDGRFGPNDPITREQMAAILYRYCKYKGYDVSIDENTNFLSYTDFQNTSEYAMPAMMWAIDNNILQGSNYVLSPRGNATREQVAAILHRFCENIVK